MTILSISFQKYLKLRITIEIRKISIDLVLNISDNHFPNNLEIIC